MPSPKLVRLLLSDGEREALGALARKRTASQALAERARIVLACAGEGRVASLTGVAAGPGYRGSRFASGGGGSPGTGWTG